MRSPQAMYTPEAAGRIRAQLEVLVALRQSPIMGSNHALLYFAMEMTTRFMKTRNRHATFLPGLLLSKDNPLSNGSAYESTWTR